MPRLEIFVKPGCFGCEEAHRLWQAVARLPEVDARLVEVEAGRSLPERVVAVPTYLLDGEVVSLGNPEPRALFVRLATAVFSGRAPLLVASGALVANLLLSLLLVIFGGICLSIGTLELLVPVDPGTLSVTGTGALAGAALLVARALWRVRYPLVLSDEGVCLGWSRIRWGDIAGMKESVRRDGGLEILARNGRRLRIPRRLLDARTYAELRQWLLALTETPGAAALMPAYDRTHADSPA